jgi:hypothetical protein
MQPIVNSVWELYNAVTGHLAANIIFIASVSLLWMWIKRATRE